MSGALHWAHKASIATLGDSEVPVDIRTLSYAAEHDGNTLIPHLKALRQELPEVLGGVQHILADDAYRANRDAVSIEVEGARLTVPIHPRHVSRTLAEAFAGIHHFTDTGVPVCDAGFFFRLWGRDLAEERYIWAAPNSDGHSPVCASCPLASPCTAGKRRHIRVDQADLPQISWDHPEHFVHNRNLYSKRTGVERSIKRITVDLLGSHLGHRDSMRVQAHFDRKLLALHLLLAVKAQT